MSARFRRIGDSVDLVGESPVWDHRAGKLLWVDIVGKAVRAHDLSAGLTQSWLVDDFPTSLGLTDDPCGIVLTKGLQFGRFDFDECRFEALADAAGAPETMRLNEGKCGPDGRFWTASMDNNLYPDGSSRVPGKPCGTLHRIVGKQISEPLADHLGIPNTIAWSPAGDVFYLGDSSRNVLWAFDYDMAEGLISKRRVFAGGGPGVPDGSAVDAEGYLWNVRFGVGCLIRYAPDGTVERVVETPFANPTSCCFGGDGLSTLFVTSARFGLTNPSEADGGIWALDTDIEGIPSAVFSGFSH